MEQIEQAEQRISGEIPLKKSEILQAKIRSIIEKGGEPEIVSAEIEKCYAEYGYGPISFSEMEQQRAARERVHELHRLNSDFIDAAYNILYRPDVEDKEGALSTLVKEYSVRLSKPADEVEKSEAVGLFKADNEKKLIYGIVLSPNTFDTQSDSISSEEIEKAAHAYMIKHLSRGKTKPMDFEHQVELDPAIARPVESYIMPVDTVIDNKIIKAGSWVMVSHIPDSGLWEKVQKGEINSYSIRGVGLRQRIETGED